MSNLQQNGELTLLRRITREHFCIFQLAKVGLPINAINGGNPLGNGIINPAGISS